MSRVADNSSGRVLSKVKMLVVPIERLLAGIDDPIRAHVFGSQIEADRGSEAVGMSAWHGRVTDSTPHCMKLMIRKGDTGASCRVEPGNERLQIVSPTSAPDEDALESL